MTVEQLDIPTLDRVLTRLDQQASTTRITCVERLLFFCLTASVYAVPVLAGATAVARTFDTRTYDALILDLQALLAYSIMAAVALAALNVRLFSRALAHTRLIRSHAELRVSDFLFGRRGRLDESEDARAMVIRGVPALLSAVLIVSVLIGLRSDRGPATLPNLVALGACLALFLVQWRCQRLFDVLRRRVDFAREVMIVRRQLVQRRRQAKDPNAPIALGRSLALRLSDLDRMFVLTNEAAARRRSAAPGITGAAVSWTAEAREAANAMSPEDRATIAAALSHLSVEVARHQRALRRSERLLPSGLQSASEAAGLTLERRHQGFELGIPLGRWRSAALSLRTAPEFDALVVSSMRLVDEGRAPGDATSEPDDGA